MWLIGVADKKVQFVALVVRIEHLEGKEGQLFAISDALISCSTCSYT